MAAPRVVLTGRLGEDDVRAVEALIRDATDVDGVQPLSEHVWLHLRHGGEGPDVNLRLLADGALAGYAHLDPTDPVAGPSAELVVHPAVRGRGYGRLLVQAALDAAPRNELRLWSHGDLPAARALARSMGFSEVRRLEQWRRSLRIPLPEAPLPPGVRLRTFRPGVDDDAWLALNAAAFARHPEQGRWTRADLQARMAEDWFDPTGFLLADQDGPNRGTVLVGFHWTKVHGGDRPADGHGHEPIGEVYVVGVEPAHQGRGLGRALTVAGLRHLRDLGLAEAMLYVESDNEPAKAVYRRLGFAWWDTDVMFLRGARRGTDDRQGGSPDGTAARQ
ncbi:MAG TPA: mycothiol synthase [Kineosporiaceae bacterium]|nr:mycothiol synthase [Kineosporiaceae bacterium]